MSDKKTQNSHKNIEILKTFNKFIHNQATSGILLLVCAIVAIIFASVPGGEWFGAFWDKEAGFKIGDASLSMSIRAWINDALMAIFFFTVGLEIKRELLVGHLSSVRRAVLPTFAALGGMLIPALIYALVNIGKDTIGGWGIPMATDIAFAIGVISILGAKVPTSLKIFLTALAIVDDLGAIVILAIFYPAHALEFTYLIYVLAIVVILLLLNKFKVHFRFIYVFAGILMWYFTYKSGVHATISGVLLAMCIPAKAEVNGAAFMTKITQLLNRFKVATMEDDDILTNPEEQHIIHLMNRETEKVDSDLHHFESTLHPYVCYLIMPLFALANAGVTMDLSVFSSGAYSVSFGVMFGLLIGKPLGIFAFSYLAIKTKLAERPIGVNWSQLFAVAILGGIGFTMSIFVTNLAFADPEVVNLAKISILVTSSLAAIIGLYALSSTCRTKATRLTPDQIMPKKK